MGSGPAQVFSPYFVKEDLSPQSSVSNVVRTNGVPGEISLPLSKDGEIAVMGDLCLSSSNSSLIK